MSAPRGRRGSTPVGVFETRPWGGFLTVEEGRGYKVKRLFVRPGRRLARAAASQAACGQGGS